MKLTFVKHQVKSWCFLLPTRGLNEGDFDHDKESHLGGENNKYSYIKISQLILTGSRGKSALLIPTTNLHYQLTDLYLKESKQAV